MKIKNGEKIDIKESSNKKSYLSIAEKKQLKEYIRTKNASHRIIVCSNFYPPNFIGGAEIIAYNQARTLSFKKDLAIIAFSVEVSENKDKGYCYVEEYNGIYVVRICVLPSNFDQSGVNFYDEDINNLFTELCEIIKPTILHCHNMIGMSLGIVDIAKEYRTKVCLTLHDHWGYCYKNTVLDNKYEICKHVFQCKRCMPLLTANDIKIPIGVRQAYFRKIFDKVDAFISPSNYLANAYIRAGFDSHRMNILKNGIDYDRFNKAKKVKSEKIKIAFVGFFGKHKGIELLIKAIAKLDNKNVVLELVGSGVEENNYKSLAIKLGILHQLHFLGKIDNSKIEEVYAGMDIYCLPSIWPENQPVSITEAMASRVPVIASNLGGNKELVKNGQTGYLFEAGDCEDLSEKLKLLIENKAQREAMGKAGQALIKEYTYENQINKLLDIYKKCQADRAVFWDIILIKGNSMPRYISEVTNKSVLNIDWIILEKDYSYVRACVIMKGEKLTEEQNRIVEEYKIPLYIDVTDLNYYTTKNIKVKTYSDRADLLTKISMFNF